MRNAFRIHDWRFVLPTGKLEIDSVSKRFGNVAALDEVSLDIHAGEFISFLGPSGCGKTTLLRLVAGFEDPTAGAITIDGVAVAGIPPNRRDIGMVFQSLALFPHMSVAENVGFGLQIRGEAKRSIAERVAESLALVDLEGYADRRIQQLSGGQRQRVALARALVVRPKLLLLDEPLSALDLKLRRQLQTELKGIQKKTGTTFIFVTHDQEEAISMSDRVAIFSAGKIEQIATPRELYREPSTEFVADFVGTANLVKGDLYEKFGLPANGNEALVVRPEHCAVGDRAKAKAARRTGKVESVEFMGAYSKLLVSFADSEKSWWIELPEHDGLQVDADGSVLVGFDPDAVARVPAKGSR